MYDIVFYYKNDFAQYKLDWLKKTYSSAQFIKVSDEFNYVVYAKRLVKNIKTSMFWFLPAEIGIDKAILNYTVEPWDRVYVHHEMIGYHNVFLIPKDHEFTDLEFSKNFFDSVKFIKFNLFYDKIYDVFFLSYNEKSADANFKKLLEKYPYARRIKNIKGIFNAHLHAALDSSTDFFWVVDADAELVEDFKFDYQVPTWDFDVVHVWHSRNKVNGLEYGNGGVKLLPRHLIIDADPSSVDVTTSLSDRLKVVEQVSNVNNFSTTPFAAWRAAFRECAKLASAVIDRQVQEETNVRLDTWCQPTSDRFNEYILAGALAGKEYGSIHKRNPVGLKKINDWIWLEQQFNLLLNSHSLEK
jgi:hypothetical protein